MNCEKLIFKCKVRKSAISFFSANCALGNTIMGVSFVFLQPYKIAIGFIVLPYIDCCLLIHSCLLGSTFQSVLGVAEGSDRCILSQKKLQGDFVTIVENVSTYTMGENKGLVQTSRNHPICSSNVSGPKLKQLIMWWGSRVAARELREARG